VFSIPGRQRIGAVYRLDWDFCRPVLVVGTSWQIAGTGDFTGNGQSGILWRNANGDTELWNPNGSGGFVGEDLGVVGGGWSVHKIFA
jgi:hypothetical protein